MGNHVRWKEMNDLQKYKQRGKAWGNENSDSDLYRYTIILSAFSSLTLNASKYKWYFWNSDCFHAAEM